MMKSILSPQLDLKASLLRKMCINHKGIRPNLLNLMWADGTGSTSSNQSFHIGAPPISCFAVLVSITEVTDSLTQQRKQNPPKSVSFYQFCSDGSQICSILNMKKPNNELF